MKKIYCLFFVISLFLLSGCMVKENANQNINNVTNNQTQNFEKHDENNDDTKIYSELKEELLPINGLYITNVIENEDTYTLQGVIYTEYIFTYDEFKKIENDGYMQINNKKYVLTEPGPGCPESYVYSLYEEDTVIDEHPDYVIAFSFDMVVHYLKTENQLPMCYRITDVYKQITIDKNILCKDVARGEEHEEVFSNYEYSEPRDSTLPLPLFNFKFKDGKCTEVSMFDGA